MTAIVPAGWARPASRRRRVGGEDLTECRRIRRCRRRQMCVEWWLSADDLKLRAVQVLERFAEHFGVLAFISTELLEARGH